MAKAIIDISVKDIESKSFKDAFSDAIADGIVLPDNATNGQVITALYPNCVIEEDFNGAVITEMDGTQFWRKDWWNSPYCGAKMDPID